MLQVTPADAEALATALEAASWRGVHALKQVLPPSAAVRLLDALAQLLKAEPTLVEACTHPLAHSEAVPAGGALAARAGQACVS